MYLSDLIAHCANMLKEKGNVPIAYTLWTPDDVTDIEHYDADKNEWSFPYSDKELAEKIIHKLHESMESGLISDQINDRVEYISGII